MLARTSCAIITVFLLNSLPATATPRHHQVNHASHVTSLAAKPAKPVNDRCPIQGEKVDSEVATRTWRGYAIGFCCPGCDEKWDAKTEAEKDAFLAKHVKVSRPSAAADLSERSQGSMAVHFHDCGAAKTVPMQGFSHQLECDRK